jgi:hypothetical protein
VTQIACHVGNPFARLNDPHGEFDRPQALACEWRLGSAAGGIAIGQKRTSLDSHWKQVEHLGAVDAAPWHCECVRRL